MATDNNKKKVFDPGLCRCCGSMKKCRLLNEEYNCLGQKEVYSDMMMDCFGLLLSHLDGQPTERLVCATCVVQLRAACCFRRQVLRCEEAFQRMKMDVDRDVWSDAEKHTLPKIEVEVVKSEPDEMYSDRGSPAEDMLRSDADDPGDAGPCRGTPPAVPNEDSTSNDDVPLLQRLTHRKTAAFPVKAAKRAEPSAGASGLRQRATKSLPLTAKNGLTHDGDADKSTIKKATMTKLQQQNRERDLTYITETNILNIVEFSYVCPFKCRHNNLLCYYCGQSCQDPATLRHHTLTEHDPRKFKVVEHKKMIKVDVTRIDCRLCDERIDNLEVFKRHIAKQHGKKYYFGYTDSVLPFRLTKDELSCTLCEQKYPYFHALNKHMNVHFSNYVCETCGLGFVDKCRFVMHQQRHEEGDFPCEVCGKMFRAQYNRDLHIDRVHNKKGRVYCPKCDVKLMSYPQKLKHLVEVHGEAPLSFPCNVCEKVYLTRRMLTIHRRKDHLKDYRYECQCCGQKFFTRFALNNHMPTHTGERNFKCKVCEKSYPRLKTLKDHMRIHSNDRRYRCHVCAQAFIQNCSLKGHMKSQHPEYM